MNKLVNEFDPEFNNLSEDEKLYADALAHLLDRDTADYAEFLEGCDRGSLEFAAEFGGAYGDD